MEESRLVSMYSSPTTDKVKAVSLDLDRWSRVVSLWSMAIWCVRCAGFILRNLDLAAFLDMVDDRSPLVNNAGNTDGMHRG